MDDDLTRREAANRAAHDDWPDAPEPGDDAQRDIVATMLAVVFTAAALAGLWSVLK